MTPGKAIDNSLDSLRSRDRNGIDGPGTIVAAADRSALESSVERDEARFGKVAVATQVEAIENPEATMQG